MDDETEDLEDRDVEHVVVAVRRNQHEDAEVVSRGGVGICSGCIRSNVCSCVVVDVFRQGKGSVIAQEVSPWKVRW